MRTWIPIFSNFRDYTSLDPNAIVGNEMKKLGRNRNQQWGEKIENQRHVKEEISVSLLQE
mgnify:CR=1 FL=1